MISFNRLSQKLSTINRKKWIWIGLGLAAVPALRNFYVQEMLAALILFSLLFVGVSIAVFAVLFLVRISKPIIAWVTPKVSRVARQSVDALDGAIASSVWAKAVPHRFRRTQLRWNERYKIICLRFAGLKPNHVYRIGLRAGGAALTSGLRAHKRISNRFGNWLTEKVTYSDLIHLASISQVRLSTRWHRRAARR